MPQAATLVPVSQILEHLVVLRIDALLLDEAAWVRRWLELNACECRVRDVPPAGVTMLIAHPSSYAGAFMIREEFPAGHRTTRGQTYARDEDELLRKAEWLAHDVAVARSAQYSLVLHAGAVCRDGAALVFPAVSNAGKTTLSYGLALRGWLPLCDDVCPLHVRADGSFVALGCPRCGHLSLSSEARLRAAGVALEGPIAGLDGYFRPVRWGQPAQVRAIVVPRYREDAELRIEAFPQAEGAVALYGATFRRERVARHDEWDAARRLAIQVPAFRLTYGSLDSALAGVETIMQVIGDERAQADCAGEWAGEEMTEHGR